MTLNEIVNYYKDTIYKFNEVIFNTNSGYGLTALMETLEKLTKDKEDNVGQLWKSSVTYSIDDLVSSDELELFISLKDNNTDPLDNVASWSRILNNYFEDGIIPIVASAKIYITKTGLMTGHTNNMSAELIRNSRWVDNGEVDDNNNAILTEEWSLDTVQFYLNDAADIYNDKYVVQIDTAKAATQGYETGSYYSALDKTTTGFKIQSSIDKKGSKEFKNNPNGLIGPIMVFVTK